MAIRKIFTLAMILLAASLEASPSIAALWTGDSCPSMVYSVDDEVSFSDRELILDDPLVATKQLSSAFVQSSPLKTLRMMTSFIIAKKTSYTMLTTTMPEMNDFEIAER